MERKEAIKMAEKAMLHHRPARCEIGKVLSEALEKLNEIEAAVEQLRYSMHPVIDRKAVQNLLDLFNVETAQVK